MEGSNATDVFLKYCKEKESEPIELLKRIYLLIPEGMKDSLLDRIRGDPEIPYRIKQHFCRVEDILQVKEGKEEGEGVPVDGSSDYAEKVTELLSSRRQHDSEDQVV